MGQHGLMTKGCCCSGIWGRKSNCCW